MKKRHISFAAAVAILVVAVTLILFYFQRIETSIRQTVLTNISELTAHDVKLVETHINRTWQDLDNVVERIRGHDSNTLRDLQEYMIQERSLSTLDTIYLIDDEGNAYTDIFTVLGQDEQSFYDYFDENPDGVFVVWDREKEGMSEQKKSSLLYGVKIEPFEVEGHTFTAIIGRAKITDIREHLQVESFDGKGNSRIVDLNGNYIVAPSLYQATNSYENIWDAFASEETSLSDDKIQEIRNQFDRREEFDISYKDADGKKYTLVFQPMESFGVYGWYFITQVSEDVFEEQMREILTTNMVQLVIVIIALVLLVSLLFASRNATFKAQAMAEARSEFLSNMSHEIRTPLNGIIGLIHQMSVHLDDRERMQEYLKKMSKTSEYLLALVNDILDMSKLQAGKFELNKEPFQINHLVDEVCSMQRAAIAARELHFSVEMEVTTPWIVGDDIRLKQVLMNLLSNAIKFTPAGGSVTLKVLQDAPKDGNVTTTFQVIDTGCGISKEFQKHIFESFAQERNKIGSSQKGTGLGLTISYMLMVQMGGELLVESKLDKGSCFSAILPAKISEEPKEVLPAEVEEEEDGEADGPIHVLVAEDNELNAEILLEILKEAGCEVDYARDGSEAVSMFEKSALGQYDIILMDVQMPIMGGYEAASAIREMKRKDASEILIFACTANTFKEDQDRAFACGMDDFLAKPVDIEKMLDKVKHLRRRRGDEKEI